MDGFHDGCEYSFISQGNGFYIKTYFSAFPRGELLFHNRFGRRISRDELEKFPFGEQELFGSAEECQYYVSNGFKTVSQMSVIAEREKQQKLDEEHEERKKLQELKDKYEK